MQTHRSLACLLLLAGPVFAQTEQEQSRQPIHQCAEDDTLCKETEHIEVHGRYIGIEVPEIIGRSFLDNEFIQATPKGNGDINEIIALLPGVQLSNEFFDIASLAEISAPEISISGSQPWQTAFSYDGMNYNNRINPGSNSRLSASSNEISGGVQSMNVNSDVVDSITVYDHNIPAEYGGFSGGVVDAQSKDPFDSDSFSIGVRGNQSSWGSYHILQPDVDTGEQNVSDTPLNPPQFEKISYQLSASKSINENHGVMLSVNYLDSTISDLSLSQTKNQSRNNINALFKYSYRDGWVDKFNISLMYSPYQIDNFLVDVKDSDFKLDGGAFGAILELTQEFETLSWRSNLNFSSSDSSRSAPQNFYSWIQAKGKEWGRYADQGDAPQRYSREGGYGSLENSQYTTNWKNTFEFTEFAWLGLEHKVKLGGELIRQQVERIRLQDSYNYDSPILWSSASTPLNCSGYTLDCQPQITAIPIEELEEQLGGQIDFTNPEHIVAYSNNIIAAAQYFNGRSVTPAQTIDVVLNRASLFTTDQITLGAATINLGLRYDYDDFLKRHNIAPRLSAGYDLLDDGKTIASIGLNRYYDAAIIGYKIKEQQKFSYRQYRPIENGYLQSWLASNYTGAFRYRFDGVTTPYDDELALGFTHAFDSLGTLSLKYVRREKKQQLATTRSDSASDDGYKYIDMNNLGTGSSERYSIAWSAQFGSHSLWANVSYSENKISNESYIASANNTPLDELVYYEDKSGNGQLVSLSQLEQIRTNFGTPVTASAGWNIDWTEWFSSGMTLTYSGSYDTAVYTGGSESIGLDQSCGNCPLESTLVDAYKEQTFKARTLLGLSLRYFYPLTDNQQLELRADISNVLNSRTYSVPDGQSGIEAGRMFWLGATYRYD